MARALAGLVVGGGAILALGLAGASLGGLMSGLIGGHCAVDLK
jgi:hypothetical protein